ncbi:MAG: hypothetical protein COV67_14625 [Nitrospinae bacterium CG11_big_fil_rev_8_21_14_0_20_56_8]|nr:MAG: hypothetical protein COV67_14625 [Nitrospinae bacterium CG11_big_fil_rev_8_21_14_0_20_56_8]
MSVILIFNFYAIWQKTTFDPVFKLIGIFNFSPRESFLPNYLQILFGQIKLFSQIDSWIGGHFN